MKNAIQFLLLMIILSGCQQQNSYDKVLLTDDFSSIRRGPYSVDVGAHTEYHYLHEAAPRSQWAVSTFTWDSDFKRAWHVRQEGDDRQMIQVMTNDRKQHTHPMVVAGDHDWENYSVSLQFTPQSRELQSGLVFRYRNDRNYYFAGVKGDSLVLKMVDDAKGFHKPYEVILGSALVGWNEEESLTLKVEVEENKISCSIKEVTIDAEDDTYHKGKVGLLADVPTKFHRIDVKTSDDELQKLKTSRDGYALELEKISESVPKMKVWKKINTTGFGVGRNLRFGDLNNDGTLDVLVGQVVNDRHDFRRGYPLANGNPRPMESQPNK